MHGQPSSVCPSVYPVPGTKSRMEGRIKLAGRKPMTRVIVTPFGGKKVKHLQGEHTVSGALQAVQLVTN